MSIVGFRSNNHPQQVASRGASDRVDDRGTRWDEFGKLDAEFGPFTLDVAAAAHNTKCDTFFTLEDDGLAQAWDGVVWCNPPYSNLSAWVTKAWEEHNAGRSKRIVMLVPANRPEQNGGRSRWSRTGTMAARSEPGSSPDA